MLLPPQDLNAGRHHFWALEHSRWPHCGAGMLFYLEIVKAREVVVNLEVVRLLLELDLEEVRTPTR